MYRTGLITQTIGFTIAAGSVMRSSHRARLPYVALLMMMVGVVCPVVAQSTPNAATGSSRSAPGDTVVGLTTPFRQATLAAVRSARIARIHKDEGAVVQKGEVVVELDDAVQRARVAIAEAIANSTLAVDLARAERDRTQHELERLERLRDDSSASRKELHDARSLALRRQLEFELAIFEQSQSVRALERERAILDEHHLVAPLSGYVVDHLKHEGEAVDPLEGIVTLVQLDPLRVTVDCPVALGGRIRPGLSATVTPWGVARAPRSGWVTYVSPIVDAGSQTIRVKVEVENHNGSWMAGMKVAVAFAIDDRVEAKLTGHRTKGTSVETTDSSEEKHQRP